MFYLFNQYQKFEGIQQQPDIIVQTLPLFEFEELYTLNDLSTENILGEMDVIYIHLWATWCAPCIRELPDIINFATQLQENTLFVLIAIDDERDDVMVFVERRLEEIPSNVIFLMDPNSESFDLFGVRQLPETFVFDGELAKTFKRYSGDQKWMELKFFEEAQEFIKMGESKKR